ncbi:MAG: hypothetical protein D6711_12910, partial [Chloroflexi bacterium]
AIPLHKTKAQFVVVTSGSRAGKTYAVVREFLRRIIVDYVEYRKQIARGGPQWPYLLYWLIAPTTELTRVAKDELFACLGGPNGPLVGSYTKRDNRLWLKGLPVCIHFISAHKPDSLRSYGINGFMFDEVAISSREAVMGNLRQRVADRSINGRPAWGIYCTTPKWKNWFYHDIAKRAIEGNDPNYKHIQFRTIGNLACPSIVEEARKAKNELSPELYRREYEGTFETAGGLVFPTFDREENIVYSVPNRGNYNAIGLDYGFSSDPGVAECIRITNGQSGFGKRIWVHSEQVHYNMLVAPQEEYDRETWAEVLDDLVLKSNAEEIFCDPSRPDNTTALSAAGVPAISGWGDFDKTLVALDRLITTRTLKIHHENKELINNLETWEWDSTTCKPKRGNDHGIDALRYGLSRFFENEEAFLDGENDKTFIEIPKPCFYNVRRMEF